MSDEKNILPLKVFAKQRSMQVFNVYSEYKNVVQSISPQEVTVRQDSTDKSYSFDGVFDEDAAHVEVYVDVVAPHISSVLEGYNCTVLVYGQSHTAKMHSVFGDVDCELKVDYSDGFVSLAGEQLFIELSKLSSKFEYTVRISFIEVYDEEVYDLFNDNQALRIYDDPLSKNSICINDLTKVTVFKVSDIDERIKKIVKRLRRHKSHNSRSNLMFTFFVNFKEETLNGETVVKTGRLNLVKLAGSENNIIRGRPRTRDVKPPKSETTNKSLITVSKVIRALGEQVEHVPYRESKLSRILQESLGGKAKTSLLVSFSTSPQYIEQTVATLDLATLAKKIVNYPQIYIIKKQDDLLKELQDEINKLKSELSTARGGEGFYVSKETYAKLGVDVKTHNAKIIQLVRQIREFEEHFKTLDEQFSTLNNSFLKTKKYLEAVEKKTKIDEEIIKEKKRALDSLTKENRELIRYAKKLLNEDEESTDDEADDDQKYQEIKMNYVSMSKDVKHASVDGLQETKWKTEYHIQRQKHLMENITKPVNYLQQQHLEDLINIPWFNKIFSSLKLETLVKRDPKEFKRNLYLFIEAFSKHTKTRLLQSEDIQKPLETMKETVRNANKERDNEKTEIQDETNRNRHMENDRISLLQKILFKFLDQIDDTRLKISNQVSKNKLWEKVLQNQYEEILKEGQQLISEEDVLQKEIQFISKALNEKAYVYDNLEYLEDSFIQYTNKPLDVIESQSKIMKQTLNNVNIAEDRLLSEENACMAAAKHSSKDIIDGFNTGLKHHKYNMKEKVYSLDSELERSKLVLEQGFTICGQIDTNMTRVEDSQKKFGDKITKLAHQTKETLKKIENEINFMRHVEDPPLEKKIVFPEDNENISFNNLCWSNGNFKGFLDE